MFSAIFIVLFLFSSVSCEDSCPCLKVDKTVESCPFGWKTYQESCYFIEHDHPQPLPQAEKECEEKGASLFVANTKEEFEEVLGEIDGLTWTGFYKASAMYKPTWQTREGLELEQMDWLFSNPYSDMGNGWSSFSQCAAHYRPIGANSGLYSFWHPCTNSYSYVCERNSSISVLPRTLF